MRRKYQTEGIAAAFESHRYDAARQQILQMIEQVRADHGPDHAELAALYEDLEEAYYVLGRYDQALDANAESMRIDLIHASQGADVARHVANRMILARRLGRVEESERLLEEARVRLAACEGFERLPLATVLAVDARLAALRGDFQQALRLLGESARVRLAAVGWSHPRFAVVFSTYAWVFVKQGRLSSAERAAQKAIHRLRAIGAIESPEFTSALVALGEVQLRQGQSFAARATYGDVLVRQRQRGLPTRWVEQRLAELSDAAR